MSIVLTGRTDLEAYFRAMSAYRKLNHSPFLVFVEVEEGVRVDLVDSCAKLLGYSDETKGMGAWPGQWRTDYFQFTIGQARSVLNEGR